MSLKEKRSSSTEGGPANEKVVINVGGIRHETYTNTLRNIPDTRLYWISENNTQLPEYDPNANEYFFDRHPTVFGQILNFYRTGKLHCPNDVCGPLFEEELAFWGIDELQVESCCWLNYKKHREAQANLDTIDGNDSDRDSLSDMDMTVYGLVANSIRNRNKSLWRKYQPKVWSTFEEPYSSRLAQAIAFTTLVLILTSVITFCLESVPYFQEESSPQYKALYIIEVICVAWFTIEFVMRLIFCPRKLQFFKKPMNWIDFGAILPFYLEFLIHESNIKTIVVLRVVRLIRVFRIFKLSRHSYGLQILGHTLRSSCSELFLLGFFLSIGVVIFSSIIYYAEKDLENTKFTTIPHSFWWAVVTMTTLGYGDMSPKSWEGKIVGSLCAVSGVLMIALPVPVIVSNFSLYYSHAKARLKLPKRKRPLIIGAANALKVAQSFVAPSSPKFPGPIVGGNVLDDDSDKDDLRGSNKSRRPSRLSVGSTPRGSPPPKRRYSNSPTTMVTPPTPRNPLLNSTQKKGHRSLLAVPEAERIEIEMEEHVPSFKILADKENPSMASTNVSASESSPSGQIFASRGSTQNSGSSSGRNSLSTAGSDPDSTGSTNDAKTPLSGRQRSASSAQSLSVDSSQGSPKQNPRGRMGRRGSLYVVGFTAKHWQNKALKKNKKTTAAQTDSGSRRASTSSTGRRGSNTPGTNESSAQRNIGVTSDSNLLSTSSQIGSKIANLTETEEITDLPESDAAGLTTNKLLKNIRGKELSKIDGRGLPSETSRTSEAYRFKAMPPNSGRIPDYYNPGKVIQTSVSVESNDSSSKYSDDSLTVNDRHRQRRGSSPLIRQKAVFTFDIPDQFAQVDPTAGSLGHAGQRWKTSSARTPDDPVISLSPLLEHASERTDGMDSNMTKKMSTEDRRKSCLPAITTERCSSKKGYSKSYPMLNGYVNGSYHEDEEDRVLANRGLVSGTLHPGSRENNMQGSLGRETDRNIEYTNHGQPYYTETKSLGQYSKPSQRHVPSVSDTCLPSISEEQADIDSRTRRFDMHRLVAPAVLPRPQSLPNWPGDMIRPVLMQRPYSDLVYMKQREANPVPFRKFSPSEVEHLSRTLADSVTPPLEVYQVPSSVINHRNQNQIVLSSTHINGMISEDDVQHPLNQRRQGRTLYVHVPQSEASGAEASSNGKENPRSRSNTSDRATSPFIFQKAESFSTPELHSLNLVDRDEFVPRRVDSNLSKSWYQSLESANKRRTIDDICANGKHAFVDYSTYPSWNSQHYQTRNSPAVSAANAFYDTSTHNHLGYLGDTSERDRNVPDDRSYGRVENSSSSIMKNVTKTDGRNPNGSPKLERTDRQVIYNGHEVLQPRESRPNSAPVFNRQRARAIFVGDSGIDSVGSTSVTSITHSLDSEIEGNKDGRENTAGPGNVRIDILNPIHETDTESSETVQPEYLVKDSRSSSSNSSKAKVQTTASHMVNILSNPDLYESSLV